MAIHRHGAPRPRGRAAGGRKKAAAGGLASRVKKATRAVRKQRGATRRPKL